MNELLLIVQEEAVADIITEAGGNALIITDHSEAVHQMMDISNSKDTTDTVFANYREVAICMENTPEGKKATHVLEMTLSQHEITCHIVDLFEGHQNYLDATLNGVESIPETVESILTTDYLTEYSNSQELLKYQQKNITGRKVEALRQKIRDNAEHDTIPTGFDRLDAVLEGGLAKGLYVIGAVSSLGKTSLTLQIADNIAASGQDVLMFNTEMESDDLMYRTASRNTAILANQKGVSIRNAKSTTGISKGSRYKDYSQTELDLIDDAWKMYEENNKHFYSFDGLGQIDVLDIRRIVEKHIRLTGNKPVVFVDYLQILAPVNERASDKQNVDKSVFELKILSTEFNIPVWVVSSFNRASYDKQVTMASFKESGAVEYSADVLIGMEFHGVGTKNFDEREAREASPRHIDVKLLKNRNGGLGEPIDFYFQPVFNYFKEVY